MGRGNTPTLLGLCDQAYHGVRAIIDVDINGFTCTWIRGQTGYSLLLTKKIQKIKHFVIFAKCQWPIILIQSEFTLILKPFTEEIWKGNKSDQRKQTWCLQCIFSITYTTTFLHIYRQLILYLNAHERSLHLLCSTCPSPPLRPVSS